MFHLQRIHSLHQRHSRLVSKQQTISNQQSAANSQQQTANNQQQQQSAASSQRPTTSNQRPSANSQHINHPPPPFHSRTLPATTASKHPPPPPTHPRHPKHYRPPRLPAPFFRHSFDLYQQASSTQLPASSKHPATSSQRPAASSPQPTTNSSSSQHPAPSSQEQSASKQQPPTSTSTQPATNSHLTHQPSPVTHLHGRTQRRHHTAPHCTTACTALRTRKPYRSIESFLCEPSIGTFLFFFFRTTTARAQDLSRMKGLCTLVILRSATGPQTDFRQDRLFQSVLLFAPALAHVSSLNPLVHFFIISSFCYFALV